MPPATFSIPHWHPSQKLISFFHPNSTYFCYNYFVIHHNGAHTIQRAVPAMQMGTVTYQLLRGPTNKPQVIRCLFHQNAAVHHIARIEWEKMISNHILTSLFWIPAYADVFTLFWGDRRILKSSTTTTTTIISALERLLPLAYITIVY